MASGSWQLTTGGAWNNNVNWSAAFPNALTDAATIATDIAADATITMGQAISVGSITFSDNAASGSAWTIAPGGAFTLTLGTSTITTTTNATISAAVGGSATVTKQGAATLTLSGGSSNTGAWTVSAGTLAITTNNVTATTGTITVNSSATLTLDAARSISKPITVANGGTATLLGSTSGALTVSGNGLTFGSSGTSTLPNSSSSFIGNTAGVNTLVTIGSGRTLIQNDGASLNITGSAATPTAVGALYVNGGTFTYNNSQGSNVFSVPLGGSYGCVLVLNNGVVNGSGTGGFLSNIPNGGAGGGVGVIEVQSGSFTTAAIVGANQTGTELRAGPFSLNLLSSVAHTAGSLRLAGGNITNSVTYPTLVNIENGATLTTTATSASAANSAPALVAISIKGAGSALTLAGYTVSGVSPKHINLVSGGKLGINGSIGSSVAAAPTGLFLYGNSNKIGGTGTGVLWAPITPSSGSSGISSVTFSGGGTGYIGPPVITITGGGGGSGAVVRPDFDAATGTITGLTVVSPGVGYTATPTLTFSGGGVSAALPTSVVVTLAGNLTDSTIEKVDAGTVSLAANNTNTGTYTITAGTLKIGNGGTSGTLGNLDTSNVTIDSGANLTFNRSDSPTYANSITGAGGISKESSGTAILTADNSGLTGPVTVTLGALRATHANALGTGGSSVTVNSGGALELANNITLARTATITGTGVSSGGALRNVSGSNSIGAVLLGGTASIVCAVAGDTLTLTSPTAFSGAGNGLTFSGDGNIDNSQPIQTGAGTVTKQGTGTTILRGTTSSYTGTTAVNAGYLGFTGSIVSGVAGNFGTATLATALTIAGGAGIRYYGTGSATFSRPYTFQGLAGTTNYLESDGTGAVTFSTAPTYASVNTKTLGLGGTGTAANTISYLIANNGANAVGVTKAGTGKWVLTNTSNSYTGATAANDGTLVLSVASWSAGAKVTSTSTVSVGASGRIQTLAGSGPTAQLGRHTYQNLTFAANARIRIGG